MMPSRWRILSMARWDLNKSSHGYLLFVCQDSGILARVEKKMDTKTDELLKLQADQSNELKRFLMKARRI